MYKAVMAAYTSGDKPLFEMASRHFLQLILLQDELLGTRREFMVGNWIDQARNLGKTPEEKSFI